MQAFAKLDGVKFFIGAAALATLVACGGGGDGGSTGAGQGTTVTGTAAKGAMLAGASVDMLCANRGVISGSTGLNGAYSAQGQVAYPCIGTATKDGLTYRGVLLSGTVANFTPMTDMLAEVILAAAAGGDVSLTTAQFLEQVRNDPTFAKNVSASADTYRATVLSVVKAQLIAGGKTEAEAEAIIAPARAAPFDATTFSFGSDLDKVLDNSASVLQGPGGAVRPSVLSATKTAGDALPLPGSSATGATGGSGNS
ncbi:MAG: hypothetical protein JSS56_23330 [Proteobacteria bacterium]|nr:hypothetical protein [Pseudomonadota bacterium]